MENAIICPVCKSSFTEQPDNCLKCGFPFAGTEKEKSLFIGQQILKKGKVSDTKDRIKRARIILWVVGIFNILTPIVYIEYADFLEIYIVLGILFIGFGFLTYKKPFISIIVPLSLLLIFYIISAIIEPFTILQGLVYKVIILSALIYGLYSIIESEKIRKESEFMKEQNYK